MSDKFKALLEKCKTYFTKEGLPFNVTVDENKVKVDALMLFCKDRAKFPEYKFEDLTLVDGATKVTIEPAVEVGAAIAFYDADGMPVPAPANPKGYELADGRIVIVEQDGIIAAITEVEEELDADGKPKAKDTPAADPAAQSVKEMIERIETVSRYATETNEKFEAYKTEQEKKYNALAEKFEASMKFNKEAFETLLSEPAKPAVVTVNNPFGKSTSGNIFEQFIPKKTA